MRLIGFVAFFCPPALVLPNDSLMVVGADHKTRQNFCLDVYFIFLVPTPPKNEEAVKYRQCHLYVVMIIRGSLIFFTENGNCNHV